MNDDKRPPYDESKNSVLSGVKVKNDREGYNLEIVSYDGGEPKLRITKFYVDREGKWRKDAKKKYERMSPRLVRWIVENSATFERGFKAAPPKKADDAEDF